jgi:hypothetical protein
MAKDIDVFGKKISIVAAGATIVGSIVAIYLVWKNHENNAASSSSTNPNAIDPVTGLPYSEDSTIDPLTGMSYLSEAQEYGSVAAAEQAVSAESAETEESEDLADEDDLTGTGTTSTVSAVPSSGYTTNAQWVAAATAGLEDLGYSASDVTAALSAYLASVPETSAQATITDTALAEYGPPPVGSYTVILASSTTTASAGSTSTSTTSSTGSTTSSTPTTATSSVIDVAPTGFRVVSVTGGDNVNLAWNPVAGATGYVIAYGPTSGSQQYKQGVGGGQTSAATVAGVGAGTAGKHYFELWATPAPTGGPHAGPIEATTTKS